MTDQSEILLRQVAILSRALPGWDVGTMPKLHFPSAPKVMVAAAKRFTTGPFPALWIHWDPRAGWQWRAMAPTGNQGDVAGAFEGLRDDCQPSEITMRVQALVVMIEDHPEKLREFQS